MNPFFVYILLCNNGSYYVRHTDDIDKRISEHNNGQISGYTKNRLPVSVLYIQDFMTRDEAIADEQQIKGWSRKNKEALIRNDWEAIKTLSNK